jgi:hypothetical protein
MLVYVMLPQRLLSEVNSPAFFAYSQTFGYLRFMKIRIKGNSIRIRLTRSEVDHFGKDGLIEEHTQFGPSQLAYVLKQKPQETMSASFENNTVTVIMPSKWAEEWINTERVGYEYTMPLPNGEELYLLVEKDFVCLDNTTEDQSDNYPNPLAEFHQ